MYKKKFNIDKQFLMQEYVENKKSSYEIAKEIGCDRKTICRYLKEYNIKIRGYTFFKGHIHKSEIIKKLSLSLKGRAPNEGSFKKGCKVWNEGTKGVMPQPWNKNLKGTHFSQKTEFKKGMTPWNKNKINCFKHTEEWKKENSKRMSLDNHPNWLGGISFEPYGMKFNKKLKEEIRKRDNYECQECHKKQKELKWKLDIHHRDYNKKNNSPTNLISLCRKCHIKTNFNRKHWEKHFKMQMFIKELFNPENILIFNENKQLIGVS